MIYRHLTGYIEQRLTQIPAVALIGPRQVGKTTLTKYIQSVSEKESVYLDLESEADLNRLRDAESYLLARRDKLVILDEVQRMPELFPILRSVIDRHRIAGRFLLLGSASPELMTSSAETLAGRVAYVEINPFVYEEVKSVCDWKQLWLRGGYPDALLQNDDPTSFTHRLDLLRTYIERDLPLLGLSAASPARTRNLLRMLAHVHGNTVNYSDLSKSLGSHINMVKNIVGYFENSYIIRLLQPWYLNVSKRLVKSPKVFIRDSGIFHVLSGIENEEELEGFHKKGSSWEGFVLQQIIPLLKPSLEYYFYRTQDGTELDLVLVKGDRPVLGVEVKYSNAPAVNRGNTIAAEDLGGIPLLIVTPGAQEDYDLKPGQSVTSITRLFQHPLLKPWLS
jgi:predicted AAA+ superfamily ATPase